MKRSDWAIEIIHAEGGFVVKDSEGELYPITGKDEAERGLNLLWFIIDFFALRLSRYERECLYADIEVGDKYELKEGEKLQPVEHDIVVKKNE